MAKRGENLKPSSPIEARVNGKKGGIASGKARREKKAMRETLEVLLAMPLRDGGFDDIDTIKSIAGVKGRNITMQEAIMVAMLNKAAKGDVRAAEYVRDTIGQKPTDKMNIDMRLPVLFEGEDKIED